MSIVYFIYYFSYVILLLLLEMTVSDEHVWNNINWHKGLGLTNGNGIDNNNSENPKTNPSSAHIVIGDLLLHIFYFILHIFNQE